jgi:Acyltransferase
MVLLAHDFFALSDLQRFSLLLHRRVFDCGHTLRHILAVAINQHRSYGRTAGSTSTKSYGVSVRVKGAEHLPDRACIVAMKHQSTWDTVALFAIFNRPVFVLKSELMWIPIRLRCRGFDHYCRGPDAQARENSERMRGVFEPFLP